MLLLTGPCDTPEIRKELAQVVKFGTVEDSTLVAIDENGALTIGMMEGVLRHAKFISLEALFHGLESGR